MASVEQQKDNLMTMNHVTYIDKNVLTDAIFEHELYLNNYPEKRAVCDSVITPFAKAMMKLGYTAVLKKGGCVRLELCDFDDCNNSYATLYTRDGSYFWACPHCQRIATMRKKEERECNKV